MSKVSQDLEIAGLQLGLPAVLKTAGFGYDGKGQFTIHTGSELLMAWEHVGEREAVLEAFIDFEREAISRRGTLLRWAVCPLRSGRKPASQPHPGRHHRARLCCRDVEARCNRDCAHDSREARCCRRAVRRILSAPGRNACSSTNWPRARTIRGTSRSMRASPASLSSSFAPSAACRSAPCEQLAPAAMANLLGDLWEQEEPDWAAAAQRPT